MGLFGIAEILRNLDTRRPATWCSQAHRAACCPSSRDEQSGVPILRGTAIGATLGILPGNGAVLGPFASYTWRRSSPRTRAASGRGAIEGVAGPEAANNAGRADLVHPAPHPRHPAERRHGAHGRRDDHPRHRARARR
jgi:putative tricarboxylic transport membrane protein